MTKRKWCFFFYLWIRSNFLERLALGGATWIPSILGILNAIFDQKYTNSGRATHLATNIKGYDLKVIRKDPKILAKRNNCRFTPLKTNMEPQKLRFGRWFTFSNGWLSGGGFHPWCKVFFVIPFSSRCLDSKPGDLGGAVTLGEPLVSRASLSEPWGI